MDSTLRPAGRLGVLMIVRGWGGVGLGSRASPAARRRKRPGGGNEGHFTSVESDFSINCISFKAVFMAFATAL